jgi:hypothetical protein
VMRDPAAALEAVVIGVMIVGAIGAVWSAIGLGQLYERIGNQLSLSRRSAARRPTPGRRTRPSKQLRAIDAALAARARPPHPGAATARPAHRRRRAGCVR